MGVYRAKIILRRMGVREHLDRKACEVRYGKG